MKIYVYAHSCWCSPLSVYLPLLRTSIISLTYLPPWSPWPSSCSPSLPCQAPSSSTWCYLLSFRWGSHCPAGSEEPLVTAMYTLHTAHCTLHIAYCTLHTANCSLHTAHFSLYSAHYKLDTTHCPFHTAKLLPAGDSWTIFPFHLWQAWSFPSPIPSSWRKKVMSTLTKEIRMHVPCFVHCLHHPRQETRGICQLILWLLTASWMSGSPGTKSNGTKYLQSTFSSPHPPPYNLFFKPK